MQSLPKRFKKVYVEISNVCNLQCSFCPEVEREKNYMEPELFKSVIGQVAPLTEEVCFHLMGEPLGHPRFAEYVDVCEKANVRVNITTNGTLLNEKRAVALLNPTISQVNFSIQSFESNFPGQNMTAYLEKIFDFAKRALIERPDLYVNFRLWNLKDGATEMAKASASAEGVAPSGAEVVENPDGSPSKTNQLVMEKIRSEINSDFDPSVDVRWKKGMRVKGRLYVHFDTRFQWPHPSLEIRSESGFCHGLSSHFGILADGRVVPCCLDKEGVITLGNCGSETTLDEIINGPRAKKMRDGFAQGKCVEALCQKCTFISRFDQKARRLGARTNSTDSGVNAANVVVTL